MKYSLITMESISVKTSKSESIQISRAATRKHTMVEQNVLREGGHTYVWGDKIILNKIK